MIRIELVRRCDGPCDAGGWPCRPHARYLQSRQESSAIMPPSAMLFPADGSECASGHGVMNLVAPLADVHRDSAPRCHYRPRVAVLIPSDAFVMPIGLLVPPHFAPNGRTRSDPPPRMPRRQRRSPCCLRLHRERRLPCLSAGVSGDEQRPGHGRQGHSSLIRRDRDTSKRRGHGGWDRSFTSNRRSFWIMSSNAKRSCTSRGTLGFE